MKGSRETWRFIDDGARSGRDNMARDEALALCSRRGSTPSLRVYRFEPATVTLGRSQPLPGLIDLEACRSHGVELVRRPTGGLAILHLDDFTYSFTTGLEPTHGARERVFQTVASGLIEALRLMGAGCRTVSHRTPARGEATWCFEGGFGVDLECEGRKICGSAQRLYHDSVLQHGSMFLVDRGDVLEELTGPGSLAGHSQPVSLSRQLSRIVEWEEVRDAIRQGFAAALGIELSEDRLGGEEERVSEELLAERYGAPGWSWP
ncbi:MAG: lipoate--protein ligase family protein [Actinomycetota bacterium]